MKIRLIWPGKTRERFIDEGIRKYLALTAHYADVSITEVREEKGKDIQRMLEKEGERITKLRTPFVLLDEGGRHLTSHEFADYIGRRSQVTFVIGGAYGVADAVKAAASERIALSKMTLTPEMARLRLLEQLYRAFTIIHKKGYHH